ncbi:MAG: hypothetical protein Q7T17_01520 [Microbacterium sp.]|uniref:hypothetical protein n=1 Tax=Microbacterium sp. TaxID=51671 RepID=UPI002716258D|nr:hypothetical protein [Microbacterium sp.]MDO8381652.1 hypothetical protein [Microbacterium sp.]
MADGVSEAEAPGPDEDALLIRPARGPWMVLWIALIYLAARLVTTGLMLLASAMSGPDSRFGVNPGLGSFIIGWDAQWYWLIAVSGYPTQLPLTDTGAVAENAWAFMPIYAFLSNVIGIPFGYWGAGGFLVAIAAGFGCCLVLFQMTRGRIGDTAALWSVGLFASAPLAALFQVAYAESLFLLWLLVSIWCVQRRRYGWLYALIPLMAFTRPGVLAFALFLGLFGLWRWFRRDREPLRRIEIAHILALGALAVATGFTWQIVVGIVTGDPGGYLATELAWRRNWVADGGVFIPFHGWFAGAEFWLQSWGAPAGIGIVAAVALMLGAAALLLFEPHVRRLGVEVRLWAASYLVYLFAVFFPQSSIFRLLFPLSPLWGAVAAPRSMIWRIGALAVCLVGQWWWIWNMYGLANTYWQVP